MEPLPAVPPGGSNKLYGKHPRIVLQILSPPIPHLGSNAGGLAEVAVLTMPSDLRDFLRLTLLGIFSACLTPTFNVF